MYNLLVEEKLDVFKCLNFKELISVQQTNKHFKALFDRYNGILAKQKFCYITLVDFNKCKSILCKTIELDFNEIKLNDEILEKWQSAIDKQIPLYLCTEIMKYCKRNIVVRLLRETLICFSNPNYEFGALKFILNNLTIIELLKIEFDGSNDFSQYKEIILNLILNEGKKFNRISIDGFKTIQIIDRSFANSFLNPMFFGANENSSIDSEIFDIIMNHIQTSKDCSNIVSAIDFPYIKWHRSDLPKKAKNIENDQLRIEGRNCNLINYEIENIFNSKIKYSIIHCHPLGLNYITRFHIHRI
uniref:F-box domain-containing protein n=1 Tax=Meloidogyne hapla TaxID=6305 RepID=A0A1I8C2N5_MELHA